MLNSELTSRDALREPLHVETGDTGDRTPPPLAQCGRGLLLVETLDREEPRYPYRIERLGTPCRVRYIFQCLHKNDFTLIL